MDTKDRDEDRSREPYRVRLPGFITESEIGLGDGVSRVTAAFGIRACGGCLHRAAMLNQWFVFSGKGQK